MNNGMVGILNVGAGDVELRFDNSNAAETIRAGRIVKDMLRRGYALLVEVDRDGEKRFERALDFDEKNNRYIVADYDPASAQRGEPVLHLKGVSSERKDGEEVQASDPEGSKPDGRGKWKRGRKSVDAADTRAVAVGRSAGG